MREVPGVRKHLAKLAKPQTIHEMNPPTTHTTVEGYHRYDDVDTPTNASIITTEMATAGKYPKTMYKMLLKVERRCTEAALINPMTFARWRRLTIPTKPRLQRQDRPPDSVEHRHSTNKGMASETIHAAAKCRLRPARDQPAATINN